MKKIKNKNEKMEIIEKLTKEELSWLLYLWENQDLGYIIGSIASRKKTKLLYKHNLVKPDEEYERPFRSGCHWGLNRQAFTDELLLEINKKVRSIKSIN